MLPDSDDYDDDGSYYEEEDTRKKRTKKARRTSNPRGPPRKLSRAEMEQLEHQAVAVLSHQGPPFKKRRISE